MPLTGGGRGGAHGSPCPRSEFIIKYSEPQRDPEFLGGSPMRNVKPRTPGRHFLQIPGPTPVPDRVLRAMDMPVLDHRGPEFQALARRVLEGLKGIFKTKSSVFVFPASGTGAWEAALVNTLSPGDKVLMFETGHFATLWKKMAESLGLKPEFLGLPG